MRSPIGAVLDHRPAKMLGMRLSTACPLDCPDTCSLEVEVEDGRLISVDAGPANPLTQGFICAKVKHHARRVYAPERVLTPLVRSGPKGEGAFRPASWDEALDLVASRISAAIGESGPASVVPYLYNSSAGSLADGGLTWRLFDDLGAARVLHTICAATAGAAWQSTFGSMHSADPHDVVHSKLVVVWGANPAISNIHFPPLGAAGARRRRPARRRGPATHRDGEAGGPPCCAAPRHRRRARFGHRPSPRRTRPRRPGVRRCPHDGCR